VERENLLAGLGPEDGETAAALRDVPGGGLAGRDEQYPREPAGPLRAMTGDTTRRVSDDTTEPGPR
jgi:hypothetical protein